MKKIAKSEPSHEQKLARAGISDNDFEQALDFLSAYNTNLSDVIQSSLLISAVITYARPFSPNEKLETAKASSRIPEAIIEFLDSKQKSLHEHLVGLRNKAIAHSEFSKNPIAFSDLKQHEFSSQSRFFNIRHEHIDVPAFKELVLHMKNQSENLMFSMSNHLSQTCK